MTANYDLIRVNSVAFSVVNLDKPGLSTNFEVIFYKHVWTFSDQPERVNYSVQRTMDIWDRDSQPQVFKVADSKEVSEFDNWLEADQHYTAQVVRVVSKVLSERSGK